MSPAERSAAARQALSELPFLTPEEVADGVRVHVNTVLRAIESGELRAGTYSQRRRRDGRAAGPYRILWEDVEAWLYSDDEAPPLSSAADTSPASAGYFVKQSTRRSPSTRRQRSSLVTASP